jgi:hypothetical protein
MTESAPAGWYPDAQDGTLERYWDGSAWTEHTQPVARAGVPESWAVASTAVASGIAPGWYGDPQNAQMERYWDGTAWTEHTRALADSGGGSGALAGAGLSARLNRTRSASAHDARSAYGGEEPANRTRLYAIILVVLVLVVAVAFLTKKGPGTPGTAVTSSTTVATTASLSTFCSSVHTLRGGLDGVSNKPPVTRGSVARQRTALLAWLHSVVRHDRTVASSAAAALSTVSVTGSRRAGLTTFLGYLSSVATTLSTDASTALTQFEKFPPRGSLSRWTAFRTSHLHNFVAFVATQKKVLAHPSRSMVAGSKAVTLVCPHA